MSRSCISDVQNCNVKGLPQLEVMCFGTPNRLIHRDRRPGAHEEENALDIETTSNQRVDLSMMVKRYRDPSEGGKGLTMSVWMCPNQREGGWKSPMPNSVCLVTLLD